MRTIVILAYCFLVNLSFAKGDESDRLIDTNVNVYVDEYTPGDESPGSCEEAKEKVSEDVQPTLPDYNIQTIRASGIDICERRFVAPNPQRYEMRHKIFDCRKGEVRVDVCNSYLEGGQINTEKGLCGIECTTLAQIFFKAKFPSFQRNADTCSYYRYANQNKYSAEHHAVLGNSENAAATYFRLKNLPCARYTCPDGETQGLWEGHHVYFEDDFDSCCHSCGTPYVVNEDRAACGNFIDATKPGQCYSKCGIGLSEDAKKIIRDKFDCTDEEMVLLEEAIEESKKVHGAGSRIGSGASITSAIVVLAAAAMNFH